MGIAAINLSLMGPTSTQPGRPILEVYPKITGWRAEQQSPYNPKNEEKGNCHQTGKPKYMTSSQNKESADKDRMGEEGGHIKTK